MSEPKRTFTDPKTGEEIASTTLARWIAGLCVAPCIVLGGVLGAVVGGLLGVLLGDGLVKMGGLGLLLGFLLGAGLVVKLSGWLIPLFAGRVHDGIARQQYLRRQRILRRQEFPHVPDGALSRAQPPGEPTPTAASLSRAEAPAEETPLRLAASVDAATEEEEKVLTARETL
jgi:predicted lipid-binding transport protein (Tim44 family)